MFDTQQCQVGDLIWIIYQATTLLPKKHTMFVLLESSTQQSLEGTHCIY